MQSDASSTVFAFIAKQIEAAPETDGKLQSVSFEDCLSRWTKLPYRANELLGQAVLDKVRHNASSVWMFAAYVQAVLLNEKTLSTFRERERFFSSIAAAAPDWTFPLISIMALDAPNDLQDFLFRTCCVVIEAFPPIIDEAATNLAGSIAEACVKVMDVLDRPSENTISVLELCITKCPERTHAVLAGSNQFWNLVWEISSEEETALMGLLAFVQRFIVTAESLTTELLRMVLVERRDAILSALQAKQNAVVIQALFLLQTLSLCKHEVICDALVGSGYVDIMATKLVVDRPSSSVFHQYVFSVLKNVCEFAASGVEDRLLGGSLVGWLRVSLLSVSKNTSAYSHLIDFVGFLSSPGKGRDRFTRHTDWVEMSAPILEELKQSLPDSVELAELLAKKKGPAAQPSGPVFCSVCNISLTAYYMIEGAVYCSDHRPMQCASCRAPLKEDAVQIGFLRYCKAHAPPSCVRCRKFVSRYINIPNEGVVCVDCGAPKCASCQQQIVQGHCVSFRKEKFHADCFVCSLCKGPLGDQFMMTSEENLICLTCGESETTE